MASGIRRSVPLPVEGTGEYPRCGAPNGDGERDRGRESIAGRFRETDD